MDCDEITFSTNVNFVDEIDAKVTVDGVHFAASCVDSYPT